MSFLRKQRRCNQCDDRDSETYVESTVIRNPVCCHKCGPTKDQKPPCAYYVHFGCLVASVFYERFGFTDEHVDLSGDLSYVEDWNGGASGPAPNCKTHINGIAVLRPICNYRNACEFVSIQNWITSVNLQGFPIAPYKFQNRNLDACRTPIIPSGWCDGCSWADRIFPYPTNSTVEYGWKLSLNNLTGVTLTHVTYGISYAMKSGETWDCFAKNTMYLTTGKDDRFTNLPTAICVVPIEQNVADFCEEQLRRSGGNQDLYKYNNEANRCACCDDLCGCVLGSIRIICGSNVVTTSANYCIGGRTGVQSPVGPSREACLYFTDTHGVSHQICVVIYCVDGGVWKADWYCDGHYDGTVTLTSTCCPLTATGNGPPLSCMDCTGCVGISVDPDCQPPPPPCCYLTSYPNTMTLTMYTGCVGWPATVTLSKAGSTFSGSFQVGTTIDTVSILFDATTCVLQLTCSSTGANSFVNMTAVSCVPSPSLTGTAAFSILNPFYCGCGFFDTVALVLG